MLISEETVKAMKPGSVILDMAVDQGGNCPLSEPGKTVIKHGVHIIGEGNLAALVAADASALYARNVLDFLKLIIDAVPDVWQTKPIGFVSYGAHSGGLRAVEQLKQVFVSLQAMPINRAVSLPYIERYFAQGQKQGADFSPGVSDRRHLDTLIDELDMWARRLQAVRAEPSASDLMAWTG